MAGTDIKNTLTILAKNARIAGVSTRDADGKMRPLLDVMRDIGNATSNMSEAERLSFFMDKFGKIAGKSAILLASAGGEIDSMRGKMASATGTAADMAKTMNAGPGGAFRSLMSAVEGVAIAIGEALAPTFERWAKGLAKASQYITRLAENNKDLLVTIGKVAAIAVGLGAALVVVGTVVGSGAAVFGALATTVALVGKAFTVLATMIGALMSPIGLVMAGLGALAAYLVTSTDVGAQALGWLGDKFNVLKDTALKAFKGIGDALAAGDIGLAARILWLSLKMEWKRGVHALNEIWVKVKEFFLSVWTEAVFGAARIATNAWAGLQAGWTQTVDFLADAWATFSTGLTKAWHTSIGFIKKAWVKLKSLFSDDVDADKEVARINREIRAKVEASDEQRNRAISERERNRKQRLNQIEGERSGTIAELERAREAQHANRQRRHASELQQTEDALADARREWQSALDEAAKKRAEAEAETSESSGAKKPNSLQDVQELLSGASRGLHAAEGKLSVTGTFNAMALRGLGGGNPAERTAKATEATAKHTKRLLDETKLGGPAFS